jgi:hypothetical protein
MILFYQYIHLSNLSLCLSACLSVCLSVRPSIHPSVRLSVCPSVCSLCLFVYVSVLSVCQSYICFGRNMSEGQESIPLGGTDSAAPPPFSDVCLSSCVRPRNSEPCQPALLLFSCIKGSAEHRLPKMLDCVARLSKAMPACRNPA